MQPLRNGSDRPRRRLAAWLFLVAVAASAACSLIVNNSTDQCAKDDDCRSLGDYSVCDQGICVMPGSHADGGAGDGGCFTGVPTTDPQFFNQCTDAGCEPFDNCARLGLCDGAGLPPLVAPPDGGV